jgi:two-component system invasion response regulator UvrY
MEALMAVDEHKRTVRTKILIVEDHESMRNSLRQWISTVFQDYEVRDTGTGEDAVELCKEIKPDVVVMDIKLPGINGILATRQIKKMFPEIQVIVLTVYDIPAFQAEAAAAGASAFISKNNMYKELVPAIEKLISCP